MKPELQTLWKGSAPKAIVEGLIPERLRVLVLAPHPDDFDAIGVTLRFLAENGNPIHAAVVQTGSGVDDAYQPGATLADKAALREREQRASLRFFGLPEENLTFLDLERDDTDQLADSAANFDAITSFIVDCALDIIFLPHGNDSNHAHRLMCSIARQAAARHGRPLALFLNRDAKTISMHVDLYLPFGDEMAEWKAQLLRFHDTQQQRNLMTRGHGFDERVLTLNRQIALDLGLDGRYAEAFELEFYNLQ
ncbi:MAG: PIG-L family deacetylase [Burkholderiaceae bacterium]|nr:PIG-L family deacetylase [Burkholderiaceae bacterium]